VEAQKRERARAASLTVKCEHKGARRHRLRRDSRCRETGLRRERGANDVASKCTTTDDRQHTLIPFAPSAPLRACLQELPRREKLKVRTRQLLAAQLRPCLVGSAGGRACGFCLREPGAVATPCRCGHTTIGAALSRARAIRLAVPHSAA